ncbi:hypothetical protein DPMN_160681 [Dreissena polymorpha]|uniref:Potassium channel tetramerisation-type BTB domain-containing protein n=1 Tax=Dreissena polymorpha TaxID=45954 RepID=A0A9D4ERP8_DREPO|nr:hypothetical protein DPMN_160681 [Dreissena polymorpha]
MLAAMFSGRHVINQDKDGRYVIDCDGKIFRHILEFLRFKTLRPVDVSEAVHMCSEYFQLLELSKSLRTYSSVSRSLELSALNERMPKYHLLTDKVIKCLSKSMAKQKDTLGITVTKFGCTCCKPFQHQFQLLEMHQITWLGVCIPREIQLDNLSKFAKEEVFFSTSNQLQARGYGPYFGGYWGYFISI